MKAITPASPQSTASPSMIQVEKKPTFPVETKELSEDAFLHRMETITLAKPVVEQSKPLVITVERHTGRLTQNLVAETSAKIIETVCGTSTTPEKKPTTFTTTITATTKSISKSKAIPQVPPFKSKITTHTRTEQESLAPILPLRGGSSTRTIAIADTGSPKGVAFSSTNGSNLLETYDDSTQSLDTDAKAPHKVAWFIVLWTFVCSWYSDLAQNVKTLLALLWASVILRLPFFYTSTSTPSKENTKATPSSSIQRNMKKPPSKHFRRPPRVENQIGKIRK